MFLIIKVRYNKKIEIYKQENVKKGTKMFFFLFDNSSKIACGYG